MQLRKPVVVGVAIALGCGPGTAIAAPATDAEKIVSKISEGKLNSRDVREFFLIADEVCGLASQTSSHATRQDELRDLSRIQTECDPGGEPVFSVVPGFPPG